MLGVDRDDLGAGGRPGRLDHRCRRRSATPCWPAPGGARLSRAARVTGRPAKPTTPLTTTSAGRWRRPARPSAPASTSVPAGTRSASSPARAGVADGHQLGPQALGLRGQEVDRALGGEGDHPERPGSAVDDLDGLGADRPRRADQAHRPHDPSPRPRPAFVARREPACHRVDGADPVTRGAAAFTR